MVLVLRASNGQKDLVVQKMRATMSRPHALLLTLMLNSAASVFGEYCWSLSIHAQTECQGQNLTRCREVFSRAKELGACMVRTDVFWGDIEGTEDGGFSNETSQFYSDFYSIAYEEYGMVPMVILSGAPGWAQGLLKTNATQFFERFGNYVSYVLNSLVPSAGPGVVNSAVYQLWNEMNDPITSGWLTLNDPNNACKMFQVSGSIVASVYPSARRFMNILVDDELPWQHALNHYFSADCAHDSIDVIGIDHYPGTWASPFNYVDWSPLDTLLSRTTNNCGVGEHDDQEEVDVLYGKEVAILETGFSDWNKVTSSLEDQNKWFSESIPVMLSVFANYSTCYGGVNDINPPSVLNIYQLVDSGAENDDVISVEAHFGLTYSDQALTIKPAFTTLQSIISDGVVSRRNKKENEM
jgi:hypothetical protein